MNSPEYYLDQQVFWKGETYFIGGIKRMGDGYMYLLDESITHGKEIWVAESQLFTVAIEGKNLSWVEEFRDTFTWRECNHSHSEDRPCGGNDPCRIGKSHLITENDQGYSDLQERLEEFIKDKRNQVVFETFKIVSYLKEHQFDNHHFSGKTYISRNGFLLQVNKVLRKLSLKNEGV